MRIVFMGTADFGIPSLELLIANGYAPSLIVTVPDKPAGRGQKLSSSPIKMAALKHGIPVLQPESLKNPELVSQLRDAQPEVIVVVAFRILPPEVYTLASKGSFNLPASVLPQYRGAAPIQWAIINGEKETGVTTFFLDRTVDTGSVILQMSTPIGENDVAGEVHDRLAQIGSEAVLRTVRMIEGGDVKTSIQNNADATPAPKIFKEHCRIDWNKSAIEVHNFIRGLSPRPGAFTIHDGQQYKIYRTSVARNAKAATPGSFMPAGEQLFVSCGEGALEVLELQQEGKRAMKTEEFLRGARLGRG